VNYQPPNTLDKPTLDEEAFQQLLAAAFTLQEEQHFLRNKHSETASILASPVHVVVDRISNPSPPSPLQTLYAIEPLKPPRTIVQSVPKPLTLSDDAILRPALTAVVEHRALTPPQAPSLKVPSANVARAAKPAAVARPEKRGIAIPKNTSRRRVWRRPGFQSNALFWRIARVIAIAAIGVLLLSAAVNRLSPLPSGLAETPDAVQQQVPFDGQPQNVTSPQPSATVPRAIPVGTSPASEAAPTPRSSGLDGSATTAASPKTTTSNRRPIHVSEADVVAPDTVIRYDDTRSPSHAPVRNSP
jgi:hypothetical protein